MRRYIQPTDPYSNDVAHNNSGDYFVIESDNGSNPITVTPNKPLHFKKLYLAGYSFFGVGKEASDTSPIVTHFDMVINDTQFVNNNWTHGTDSRSSNRIALPLNGQPTTFQMLSPPMFLCDCSVSRMNNFSVTFLNPDGTNAVYTQCFILLYYKN